MNWNSDFKKAVRDHPGEQVVVLCESEYGGHYVALAEVFAGAVTMDTGLAMNSITMVGWAPIPQAYNPVEPQ